MDGTLSRRLTCNGADMLSNRKSRGAVRSRSAIDQAARCTIETLERRTFLAAGELDPSFGVGGTVIGTFGAGVQGTDIDVLPGGKFLLTGYALDTRDRLDLFVARFNATGSIDTSFGQSGRRVFDSNLPFNQTPMGRLDVLASGALLVREPDRIVRLTANGAIDTSWGGGDGVVEQSAGVAVVNPDGSLVRLNRFTLSRLTPAGTPDPSFVPVDLQPLFETQEEHVAPESLRLDHLILFDASQLLVGGTYVSSYLSEEGGELTVSRAAVARLTLGGEIDRTFGDAGVGRIDAGEQMDALAVGAGDIFFVSGGYFVSAFTRRGEVDSDFVDATPFNGVVRSMLVDSAGREVYLTEGPVVYRSTPAGEPDRKWSRDGLMSPTGFDHYGTASAGAFTAEGNLLATGLIYDEAGGMRLFVSRIIASSSAAAIEHFAQDRAVVVETADGADRIEVTATPAGLRFAASGETRTFAPDEVSDIQIITGGGADTVLLSLGQGLGIGSVFIDTGVGNDQVATSGDAYVAIVTGDGADRITADNQAMIESGDGNDTISTSAADDGIYAGPGNDSVSSGAGNDLVVGDEGDDTLSSGAGDDTLDGRAGRDSLAGGTGNDWLHGGDEAESDTLAGGADDDMVSYAGRPEALSLWLDGLANDGAPGENDLIAGDVEAVEGGVEADLIIGNDLANFLIGGGGEDTLRGLGGNDGLIGFFMDGGAGNDSLSGGTADYSARTGNLVLAYVPLDTGEAAFRINGTSEIDVLADASIRLGAGNDTITLPAWVSTGPIFGGGGDDRIEFVQNGEFSGAFNGPVFGEAGNDTIIGGAFTELFGGDGNDSLAGGMGNNFLSGGPGRDTLVAGPAVRENNQDVLDYSERTEPIWVNLRSNLVTGEADVLVGTFEGVVGGAGNDTLIGGGSSTIEGRAGDDQIVGTAGDDMLDGGEGNDFIDAGAGGDYITPGSGNDSVQGGDGDDYVFDESGRDLIETGGGADYVSDTSGDNTVRTGAGRDVIYLGDGNDFVNAGTEADDVYAGPGNDSVFGQGGADSIGGGEGDDKLYGDNGGDYLYPGEGNDSIYGGANNDFIFPSFNDAGRDYYSGGRDSDWLMCGDYAENLRVLIDGQANDGVAGEQDHVGSDVENFVMGSGNDKVMAGPYTNRVYGGDGNDVLFGGAGNDTLDGGPGADQLFGQAGNDRLIARDGNIEYIVGGDGTDTATVDRGSVVDTVLEVEVFA